MSDDQSTPTPSSQEIPATTEANSTSGSEADVGKRIAAALIDCLVASAVAYAVSMIAGSLSYPAAIGYMLTRDSLPFLDGQSIGKKVLNIRAVTETGESLSGNWNPGIIRNVPMIIPVFPLVEFIILLANKDKPGGLRRFGDQWGNTKVVNI
ncbi:MAG: RDD family protein [Luteolibacter sp.]